jgi:hypothetical protein
MILKAMFKKAGRWAMIGVIAVAALIGLEIDGRTQSDDQLAALRAEIALLKLRQPEGAGTSGTNAVVPIPALDDESRAAK